MSKFYIVTREGREAEVSKSEFKTTFNSGDYFLYKEDRFYVLLHKGNDAASTTYRAWHNYMSNEWGKNDRLHRCLDEKGNICKGDCRTCDKERESRVPVSLDERISEYGLDVADTNADIEARVIGDDFIAQMHSALERLDEAERRVIKALYGVGKPAVSLSEYAEIEGLKYSTARSHRDRAMRKLQACAQHLKDYFD